MKVVSIPILALFLVSSSFALEISEGWRGNDSFVSFYGATLIELVDDRVGLIRSEYRKNPLIEGYEELNFWGQYQHSECEQVYVFDNPRITDTAILFVINCEGAVIDKFVMSTMEFFDPAE